MLYTKVCGSMVTWTLGLPTSPSYSLERSQQHMAQLLKVPQRSSPSERCCIGGATEAGGSATDGGRGTDLCSIASIASSRRTAMGDGGTSIDYGDN